MAVDTDNVKPTSSEKTAVANVGVAAALVQTRPDQRQPRRKTQKLTIVKTV